MPPSTERLAPDKWRPILRGAAREHALGIVEAIASALQKRTRTFRFGFPTDSPQHQREAVSLSGGRAGISIFFAYLAAARAQRTGFALTNRILEEAAAGVAALPMTPSLYGGFTGVAWAMAHFANRFPTFANANDPTVVDTALLKLLRKRSWQDDYDLISGLVGFGVYALERLPRAAAADCLHAILRHLEDSATETAEGICWFTAPEKLPRHQREWYPRGCYNLGLAHGLPGVIAILARLYAAGIARRKSRTLLEGAIAWLEAQRLPPGAGAIFPPVVAPGLKPAASRTAWCYGDPGIAIALFLAGQCLSESAWRRRGIEIALDVAKRTPEEARVVDAGLCHGAAGLAHILNRIYQATGEKSLARAAQRWLVHALELRRARAGIAGFAARFPGPNGKAKWIPDPGILTGAAGVALAFLAAATGQEPEWDRMLLLSPRRQSEIAERV